MVKGKPQNENDRTNIKCVKVIELLRTVTIKDVVICNFHEFYKHFSNVFTA